MNRKNLTIGIIILLVLFIGLGGILAANTWLKPSSPADTSSVSTSATPTPQSSSSATANHTATYQGQDGKTALELLQQKYPDTQVTGTGVNAFVISINGYTANSDNKEYWAFYVNGKAADVGAGAYTTKSGETIEWKIATY